MAKSTKLTPSMTIKAFDNGYWYASDLKVFAKRIDIPGFSKLRKDELEKAIKHFLHTGKVISVTARKLERSGKDTDLGLNSTLLIVNYTSNRETKEFLHKEALKIVPDLKKKSGARYRLNRWREEQLSAGKKITYGDLVKKYIELNQFSGEFEKILTGRYINFLAEFLAKEKNATHSQAIRAWKMLKKMDTPKTYTAWKKSKNPR